MGVNGADSDTGLGATAGVALLTPGGQRPGSLLRRAEHTAAWHKGPPAPRLRSPDLGYEALVSGRQQVVSKGTQDIKSSKILPFSLISLVLSSTHTRAAPVDFPICGSFLQRLITGQETIKMAFQRKKQPRREPVPVRAVGVSGPARWDTCLRVLELCW
ncbi:Mas-Related G-Protein Coupled Receptor Member X1 [Manis pentadactyla]|nr:Mas-Related G-Protein Coupled Receptor Member X1 [Manis pentadactyla]